MLNILISGGSDGLGKAIATQLSPSHHVIILARQPDKLKLLAAQLKCDYVVADVTDYPSLQTAVSQVIDQHGPLDVLINNAGIWMQGPLEDGDYQQIEEVIRVNTLGTIFLTKLVLPAMKSRHGGKIINIVSQDGLQAKKMRSVYSASKWAITGFTRCLREDLLGQGVGVTGVFPGLINTSLFQKQGFSRDLKDSLSVAQVANLIEFVINLPTDTLLPEIIINNINYSTNMDDTNTSLISAPQADLNINPDLMAPPAGTPTPSVVAPAPVAPAVTTPGVIDITPGATSSPTPVMDSTTPDVPVVTPAITLPVDQGVIDITPSESDTPAPAATSTPVAPAPVAPVAPVAPASPTPAPELQAPTSPLAEDPSSVALGQ